MPTEPYPPPHIYPSEVLEITPDWLLLATDEPLYIPELPAVEQDIFFNPEGADDEYDSLAFDGEVEASPQSVDHEAYQDAHPAEKPYFLNRGAFSEEEKLTIQECSEDTPSAVMATLKGLNPAMEHSYRQVKGALENERRKKNRREGNGPWTVEEVEIIKRNLDKMPKELVDLLRNNVFGCTKNIDQVRDIKYQLVQKAKKRGRDLS